ncbi:MAG: AFG1 family ATPase [Rhizobiales bacterium]|nr:AFG1 family ATPase [Hyphomicrobiales bacterium]
MNEYSNTADGTFLARYRSLVAAGQLRPDPAQERIAARLDALGRALASFRRRPERGILSRLIFPGNTVAPPRSIYIFGEVGRGKTMLMDIFAKSATVSPRQRVHFHAFMQDVHARIFALRQSMHNGDAVAQVAAALGDELALLCLDEMQINDIADAMIVGRLFEGLLAKGTVIVTTSNVAPGGLYPDGLNRQLFLPFVKLIEDRFDVLAADGTRDYRLGRVKGDQTFITPLGPEADARLESIWEQLTDTERGVPASLTVNGRSLEIPEAARDCARFTFAQLCQAPLGAADFLAIAAAYRTIFVENIPQLSQDRRNEIRRLVLFVDTLYDAQRRLVATAEVAPRDLFTGSRQPPETARTISRLEEMQSAGWWEKTGGI